MKCLITCLLFFFGFQTFAQQSNWFFRETENHVEILFEDHLITNYFFEDSLRKPVFWPIQLPDGEVFTRSFPVDLEKGEAKDHPHHVGVWLSYGEVDEVDFWRTNWYNFQDEEKGSILHGNVSLRLTGDTAIVENTAFWVHHVDTVLVEMSISSFFFNEDSALVLDRKTQLYALKDIHFHDSKEGMFALRVSSDLQENKGGVYLNSEGQVGSEVWGQPARWVALMNESGKTVLFLDHEQNVGYPAYWMARGYGLFAVNPLGVGAYTENKSRLDMKLRRGEDAVFRYQILFSEEEIGVDEAEIYFEAFQRQ